MLISTITVPAMTAHVGESVTSVGVERRIDRRVLGPGIAADRHGARACPRPLRRVVLTDTGGRFDPAIARDDLAGA